MVSILMDIHVRYNFPSLYEETSAKFIVFIVFLQKRKSTTIVAILKSRRLLSDHSEVLEECFANDYNNSGKSSLDKYFNGTSCSLLITSSIITSKFVSKRYDQRV